MTRKKNTNTAGEAFDEETIKVVWKKAKRIPGRNAIRGDICGTKIFRSDYGKTDDFGWEIDHIKPVSKDGTDDFSNLQPLHWKNNRRKGDKYPWSCDDEDE